MVHFALPLISQSIKMPLILVEEQKWRTKMKVHNNALSVFFLIRSKGIFLFCLRKLFLLLF